jgi:DNA-binding LacI/PurR family transcriptional regulator
VLDDENGYWIDNDHVSGATSMLQHLEQAGARRTALLTGPPVASYTYDCMLAYETWCGDRGLKPQVIIPRGVLSEAGGFEAAGELLDGEDPPDAIYATLDRMAIGALRAALVRGLKVPHDLLIGSHTDGESVRWAQPSLTALALHPEEIGTAAMDMLTTLIDGVEPEPRHVTIASQVVIRASTKRTGAGVPETIPAPPMGAGTV